jgi:hypothetical protein
VLGRAARWIREQIAFLLVLAILIAAFVYLIIQPGRWGRGAGVVSVAVLSAGLLRLLLPSDRVGMLAVRGRIVDTVCFLLLGGLILAVDIRLHG